MLERGDKPEKGGGGVDVEMEGGGLALFYYFTVQSHLLCMCGESKVPFITFRIFRIFRAIRDSHLCLYCTKILVSFVHF